MAILIQKSAGNISALKSGNEFYENCYANNTFPNNGGGNNVGYRQLSATDRNIHFTPTKAGNFKGVILSLYNLNYNTGAGTQRYRDIRIRLQENTGSWVTRLEQTFSTNDFIPDNTWAYGRGLIDCRFTSTYAITTAASTWRFVIDYVSGGSGTFYFNYAQDGSNNDNLFMIPYLDSTATLTNSDTLVVTDRITLDQNLTLDKEDTDHGTNDDMDYRSRYYSIWSCQPNVKVGSETNPQIYVPSTVAGNYKIDLKGCWHLSSYQPKALLVGEDTANPIPYNWANRADGTNRTFELEFSEMTSGVNEPGMISGSLVGYRYGKLAGFEFWGSKPSKNAGLLKSNALSGQATAVLVGDLTGSWAVGDHIMCGGAKYSSTRFYRDYAHNEIREIQSITYSAGNDDTTIVFTTTLTRNHYYYADANVYFTLKERNIIVGGQDTTYTAESYWSIQNGTMKAQGVLFHDIQYMYFRYSYSKYMSAQQKIDSKMLVDNCNYHDCYRPIYIYYWQTDVELKNNTSSSDLTGTTMRCDRFLYLVYSKNAHIHDNILVGRMVYGVGLGGSSNCTIEDNHFNIRYATYLSSGATGNIIKNNDMIICRIGHYFAGANNNYFENNKYRYIYYDSNYSATSESSHGCYFFAALYNNPDNVSVNEDADWGHAFVVCQNDAMGGHVFKNCKFGTNWKDDVVNEGGATYRSAWNPGGEIKFEDYNEVTGQSKAWYTKGYIESCGVGLEDTTSRTSGAGKKAWRLNTYFTDAEHSLEFTIPVGVTGEPITVSIFCKINSVNYAGGTYQPPKLTISGLGVSGVATECEADVAITDWQLLVVSGTPTLTGQLGVKLSIETDEVTTQLPSLNTDGSVYWDDMYIAYKTPLDLGGLDLVYNGLPIFPPLTVVMTASAVWAEQLSANTQPGSMGLTMEGINDIKGTSFVKNTDSLVDIRPETDKIQTGIIDTPNTYKANVTNLDVAVSTRNATTPPTVGDIKTELEGVGTKLTTVKDQTDKLQFAVGNDIKATLDSEEVTTDTASRTASKATGYATLNPPSQNLDDYKANVTNLDTTVSSRSSHSAGDVWTAGSRALSTPNDYKADVSTLATTSALSTHDTKLDTVDGNVDRILKATEIKQCTITDASPTQLSFTTNLTETSNQFWQRGVILITSGNNEGQIRAILNYNGSTKAITIKTPLDVAPAQNDTFIILAERKYLTPDIEDIIGAVWDEPIASHTDVLHFGGKNQKVVPSETINDYKAIGFATENPPSQNLADYKADVTNLDVAVSTRSSHSDPTSSIKGLDNKDLTQVFDNEKGTDGAYTGTPPTVTDIRTEMDSNSTKMAPSQVLDDYKATGFNTTTPPTVTEIRTKMEEAGSNLDFIKNIEGGKWEIVSNQMIFYKADGVTEICRFNLFDSAGNPTMTNVYKRELV